MVRSIDLRYEQVRGTHRPNKVARLIGTRVAETILASGLTSCTNRPDIWTQAIRSNLTKLLCHGGRPHMGPGLALCAPRDDTCYVARCGTASNRDTTISRLVSSTRTVISKRPSLSSFASTSELRCSQEMPAPS